MSDYEDGREAGYTAVYEVALEMEKEVPEDAEFDRETVVRRAYQRTARTRVDYPREFDAGFHGGVEAACHEHSRIGSATGGADEPDRLEIPEDLKDGSLMVLVDAETVRSHAEVNGLARSLSAKDIAAFRAATFSDTGDVPEDHERRLEAVRQPSGDWMVIESS